MTNEELRAAIETALKRRDPEAYARCGKSWSTGEYIAACGGCGVSMVYGGSTAEGALRPLAAIVGLRDDGSDPAEEVERLTRELAEARAALVDAAPWCDAPMCHAPATHWRPAGQRSERACDSHAIGDPAWDEDEHAAALRAAEASQ